MNKQSLGALIALNVVLLVALVLVGLPAQSARAEGFIRPQYAMISGQVPGRIQHAIYVVDLSSARVAVVIFDAAQNNFEVLAPPQPMFPG